MYTGLVERDTQSVRDSAESENYDHFITAFRGEMRNPNVSDAGDGKLGGWMDTEKGTGKSNQITNP